jgi:hypothetical protein
MPRGAFVESNDRSGTLMEYPQPSAVEERLKQFAIEVGDATLQPFRVDLVRVHGGKPPIYCVVIRSFAKEPLRQRLEQLLNRLGSKSCRRWHLGTQNCVNVQHFRVGQSRP